MKGDMGDPQADCMKRETRRTAMWAKMVIHCQRHIHDIGKNLVSMMMEVAGLEVVDLWHQQLSRGPTSQADGSRKGPDILACTALAGPRRMPI